MGDRATTWIVVGLANKDIRPQDRECFKEIESVIIGQGYHLRWFRVCEELEVLGIEVFTSDWDGPVKLDTKELGLVIAGVQIDLADYFKRDYVFHTYVLSDFC